MPSILQFSTKTALFALCATLSLPAAAGVLDGATSLEAAQGRVNALDNQARAALVSVEGSTNLEDAADALMVKAILDEQHELDTLKSLRGIDPEVYLQYRRPDPVVGKEISEAGYHIGALLLAERFPDSFLQKRPVAAYPAWAQKNAASYIVKEREAFQTGVIVALAKSTHPTASAALKTIVFDVQRDEGQRATSATMYGESSAKDKAAVLSDIASDSAMPAAVRSSAIVGLGKVRERAAFDTLKRLVQQSNATYRESAIRALGNLGSKWAHESAPTADSEQLRADATVVLVEALPKVAGTRAAEGVAMSLATIAHPSAPERLASLAQSNKDARARSDIRNAERLVKRALSR